MKRVLGFKGFSNGWSWECNTIGKLLRRPAYNPLEILYFWDKKILIIRTPRCRSYQFERRWVNWPLGMCPGGTHI